MKRIVMVIAFGLLATACTPREIALWADWHSKDPAAALEFANSPEIQAELNATVAQPTEWSSASSNGRCVGFEGLLAQYSPGWDVSRMSAIMYRESRCKPDVANSCCTGLLQMHRMHVPESVCAVWSRSDLYDPGKNICAAAELWQAAGYSAWSL